MVESNASGHERTRTGSENRYPASVNIVPACEVIHDMDQRRLQIRTAEYLIELCAGARPQKVHRQQRYAASAGITRHLVEILFLSMAWLANANDQRRSGRGVWSGQEITLQGIPLQPGNLDDLTGGRAMFEIAARASPHGCERGLPSLIGAIERQHGGVVIIRLLCAVRKLPRAIALSARSLLASAIRFHSWNQESSSLGSIRLAVRKHSEMMEPPS